MKTFNLAIILLIPFLVFCTGEKKESTGTDKSNVVQDTVFATLNYNTKFLPGSPYRIDSVIVDEEKYKHLYFVNNTQVNTVFVIPNWNKLFKSNNGYPLYADSLSHVQYLFIPLATESKSKKFHIDKNANPDNQVRAVYPFSAFCDNGKHAAERNSSPIIIVEP